MSSPLSRLLLEANICPVCGYDGFEETPTLGDICPSCGTEYGFNDERVSHKTLRQRWEKQGCKWWSHRRYPSSDWNAEIQLANLDRISNIIEHLRSALP